MVFSRYLKQQKIVLQIVLIEKSSVYLKNGDPTY